MKRCIGLVVLGLVMAFAAACTDDTGDDVTLLQGFVPPSVEEGEVGLVTEIIKNIPAGADINYCTYLPYTTDRTMDVVGAIGKQSLKGGHHALLYIASNPQAPGTHECTEEDMLNARYVAAAGGGNANGSVIEIPDGIGFRVPEGVQLFVQSHWVNASDEAIDGQIAFSLNVQEPTTEISPAQLLTVVDTEFTISAGAEGNTTTSCTFPEDISFFIMGGHAHEYGSHVRLRHKHGDTGVEETIYETEWQYEYASDPPMNAFSKEEPYVVKAGDTISVDCSYLNTENHDIRFPQEMCVGFGYYFPAVYEINCADGRWPDVGNE